MSRSRTHDRRRAKPCNEPSGAAAVKGYLSALVAGGGWTWAAHLLAARQYETGGYHVLSDAAPLLGSFGLPVPSHLFVGVVGVALALACGYAARARNVVWLPPVRFLAAAWLIPALDGVRLARVRVPLTFLEPLLLTAITGVAVALLLDEYPRGRNGVRLPQLDSAVGAESRRSVAWFTVVCVSAALCCGWWYLQARRAYDDYLLGYNDFGHFGWRVANTWEGRGFLSETPSLPAFWDHFNPGLALLAPLWGLWPDPRLFLWIQAICLSFPALTAFGVARRLGAGPAGAAAWAGAYLLYPATGQLNLNYTYGWHPVSLALPLIWLALWALLSRRKAWAGGAAIAACSFQEDVFVVLSLFAFAMALQAWLHRRAVRAVARAAQSAHPSCTRHVGQVARLPEDGLPFAALPVRAWLGVGAALAIAFVVVFGTTPFSQYQTSRFSELGDSAREILLSPLIRPAAFWGAIFRMRCGYFLLCLAVPLGVRCLLKGWPVLLVVFVPLAVLLAWRHPPATNIAFQYTTCLIPFLFLASITGAVASGRLCARADAAGTTDCLSRRLGRAGVAAWAAGMVASVSIGAMPWTSPTLIEVWAQTYASSGDLGVYFDRAVGSKGNDVLNRAVALVRGRQSAVLASGRIAAHLLTVRRLETVGQACARWSALENEAGPERAVVELFDWVALDTKERFYQDETEIRRVLQAAERSGYQTALADRGIVVMARPGTH